MRILILGGDGMLGHQLFKHLKSYHDVRVTLRQDLAVYKKFMLFEAFVLSACYLAALLEAP